MKLDNKVWSDKIIQKFDPSFHHRWEIYDDILLSKLNKKSVWIDLGCGDNSTVERFGRHCSLAIGVDLSFQKKSRALFVAADLRKLPFKSNMVDLIALRFVVEHLQKYPDDFQDLIRVLKQHGRILILTTNLISPFIFIPRVLPFKLKSLLLRILFRVKADDVLPTYHKYNSLPKFRKINKLKLVEFQFIQDANYQTKWVFLIFFFWHIVTRAKSFNRFRTNMLVVLQKFA